MCFVHCRLDETSTTTSGREVKTPTKFANGMKRGRGRPKKRKGNVKQMPNNSVLDGLPDDMVTNKTPCTSMSINMSSAADESEMCCEMQSVVTEELASEVESVATETHVDDTTIKSTEITQYLKDSTIER